MIEIKFKAWDKLNKKFVDLDFINFENGKMIMIGADGYEYDRENIELLQYTGTKDEKGKEIYEGDIVRIHAPEVNKNHLEVVRWEEWHSGDCLPIGGWGTNKNAGWNINELEVIGNIYENPELLKDDMKRENNGGKK